MKKGDEYAHGGTTGKSHSLLFRSLKQELDTCYVAFLTWS